MKTLLKWIAYVSIATGIIWMASNHLAGDTRSQRSAKQPNGQPDNVEFDPAEESKDVIVAPRYGLFKDLKPGEKPQTGPKVLYQGSLNKKTGHIVLQLPNYVGSRQTFSWLPVYDPETGWAGGEWTTITREEHLMGKIRVKELPGGSFKIERYHMDESDSTKWHRTYTGTITPDWTAG